MMDTVSEILLSGIARTTLCTTLAALATLLLLPTLGIRSARIHQMAWVLVILQGWTLVPLTFTVSVPSVIQPQQMPRTPINHSDPLATISSRMLPQSDVSTHWQRHGKQTVTLAWLLGTLMVLGFYLKRYYSLATLIPFGCVPESEEWNDEWDEVADGVSPQTTVCFRVTNRAGPLLCYVPWVYLVLVPKLPWANLNSDDRIAILRHEVAHLNHGDLWKNLIIRVLALPQWFNPLVWLAIRRFEEAGEWACDEEVLISSNLSYTGYASTLLRVAGFSANSPCGAVAASGGVLTRRVTRLLSSSDKEVSKMKNVAVPLLLLGIAAGQAIRIESVRAEDPAIPTLAESRAEAVASLRAAPYRIEPPDVLSIELVQGSHRSSGSKLKTSDLGFNGKHLVGPDGRVSLADYGSVSVAGMTVAEVRVAIEKQLSLKMEKPDVFIDVLNYNSKVVYLIEKRDSGDFVHHIPCTKELNVLKVLHSVEDLGVEDHAYIVTAGKHTERPDDRLEVDLEALLTKSDLTTNYDLVPSDRIFIVSQKETNTKRGSSKPTIVLPSPDYEPHPYQNHSALPAGETNEPTPLSVGSLVFLRFQGDIARRLMHPLKKLKGPSPGLTFEIVAQIVAINSKGHLNVEATDRIAPDGRKLRRTISGVVRPVDVGPDNYVNYDDIAFLRIEMFHSKAR